MVIELKGFVEDLSTVRENASCLERTVAFPVDEEFRVGLETSFAVQLNADVGVDTTMHLQVVTEVGDVDKLAKTVLANYFVALHLEETLGLLVIPMGLHMCKKIFQKLEALFAA